MNEYLGDIYRIMLAYLLFLISMIKGYEAALYDTDAAVTKAGWNSFAQYVWELQTWKPPFWRQWKVASKFFFSELKLPAQEREREQTFFFFIVFIPSLSSTVVDQRLALVLSAIS